MHPLRLAFVGALLALSVLSARPAQAQVHWDASVHTGVAKRFFSSSVGGGLEGSVGPVVGVQGDVAVFPLVRIGAYSDFEYAYTAEPKSPFAWSLGARVRVGPPFNYGNVHWYGFVGFGTVLWNAPGYQQTLDVNVPSTSGPSTQTASSAGGYFFEVPIGLGLAWRFRKPWELVVEASGRVGFGSGGSYFTDDGSGAITRPATSAGSGLAYGLATGNDVGALLLTVGIGLDE